MNYAKISKAFWTDLGMEKLTPEQRYFYIYLFSNPRSNAIGIYEFSVRTAAMETGYNIETVHSLLKSFTEMGKIIVSELTGEICVKKYLYYNHSKSPKAQAHYKSLITSVKDKKLIQYIYSIDTLWIQYTYYIANNNNSNNNSNTYTNSDFSESQDVGESSVHSDYEDLLLERVKGDEVILMHYKSAGHPYEHLDYILGLLVSALAAEEVAWLNETPRRLRGRCSKYFKNFRVTSYPTPAEGAKVTSVTTKPLRAN